MTNSYKYKETKHSIDFSLPNYIPDELYAKIRDRQSEFISNHTCLGDKYIRASWRYFKTSRNRRDLLEGFKAITIELLEEAGYVLQH